MHGNGKFQPRPFLFEIPSALDQSNSWYMKPAYFFYEYMPAIFKFNNVRVYIISYRNIRIAGSTCLHNQPAITWTFSSIPFSKSLIIITILLWFIIPSFPCFAIPAWMYVPYSSCHQENVHMSAVAAFLKELKCVSIVPRSPMNIQEGFSPFFLLSLSLFPFFPMGISPPPCQT